MTIPLALPPPQNWQDFERLCRDLWAKVWGDPDTQRNGREGQPQAGVDVFGRPQRGRFYAGVQCKLRDQLVGSTLTADDIQAEVAKAEAFQPPLASFIIATTGPRDVRAQAAARELTLARQENGCFPVTVYSWNDIVDLLEEHSRLREKYYPFRRHTVPLPAPKLPPHYLVRPDHLGPLKKALLADSGNRYGITGAGTIGLEGMGGIGKSVLAAAVSRDPQVEDAFPDGVLWLPVGQQPDLLGLLVQLAAAQGETQETFKTVEEARNCVAGLLADAQLLLVLDDVWELSHAEALDVVGPKCRLLITTRNAEVVTSMGAAEHRVGVLNPEESLSLLADWADQKMTQLPAIAIKVAQECGYLPLALAMIGAMVRRTPTAWDDAFARLQAKELDRFKKSFPGYPYPDLLRALEVSVEALPEEHRQRYFELAVFPEDVPVPQAAVETLWSAAGLSPADAREHIACFADHSLLTCDEAGRVLLHDLQADYVARQVADLPALHRRLVEAYRTACPDGFASGADDRYYFQHLPDHLAAAGMDEELNRLLFDLPWLGAKLAATEINALLADYRYIPGDPDAALLTSALRLSANVLARDPHQLAPQLLGRLGHNHSPRFQSLLARATSTHGGGWLRPRFPNLTSAGGPLFRILVGHTSWVTAVAVLDPTRVVSASWDRTLRIWDVENGETLHTLEGPDELLAVAVLDPRHVISGSYGRPRVWDLETGKTVNIVEAYTHGVKAVAVLDPRCVISVAWDRTLRVWDLETGEVLRTLEGHTNFVTTVAVLDARRVVSASLDRTLRVWAVESGKTLKVLEGHTDTVNAVALLDPRRVVSGSSDHTVRVWDVESGKNLSTLKGHTGSVNAVAVLDPRRVVSASDDQTLRVWDLEMGQVLNTLEGHSDKVNAVAALDPRRVVSASNDRTLRVWYLQTGKAVSTLERHTASICILAVLDPRRVVSASTDGTLRVWDVKTGKTLLTHTMQGLRYEITALAVLDSQRVVSASANWTLQVWDTKTGKTLRALEPHNGEVNAMAVLDLQRVVSASWDSTLRVWNAQTGKILLTLEGHIGNVTAVAVLDPRRVASASWDRTLRVWDVKTGKTLKVLKGHTDTVYAVAVLDPRRVVSASRDQTLRVWDVETGKTLNTLQGHTNFVTAMAVLDPRRIVSASEDGTIRVWDTETGETLHMASVDAPLRCVQALHTGELLIAGDATGRMHFFDLMGPQDGVSQGPTS